MDAKQCSGIRVGVFQILGDLPAGDPALVAKRAEDRGFASYWLPEHVVIPKGSAELYPGRPMNEPPPEYLYKFPDPFIGLSRAAATTRTIQLGTGISLVPEHDPLLAAKQIASLDHYSGGRFVYGIGAGWNEAECAVMGGDFAHRWTQTTEAIEVMKKLWTGEYVEHHGKYFDFPPVICLPRPVRRPHPPILLGSIGSPNVFRRVARWGDGWLPFSNDPAEIARGKAEIAKHAREAGRDPASLRVWVFLPVGRWRTAAEIREFARAGADQVILWLADRTQAETLAELDELAGAVF
jgi:probable F420-dependent oxidoreductase